MDFKVKKYFQKGKKVKIIQYYNGNYDGYSYTENCYELCVVCTEKLTSFLSNGNLHLIDD